MHGRCNAKRWISTILRKDKGLWIVYTEDNSGGLNRLLNNIYGISQLTEHQRSQSFIVRAKLYCKRLPIQNKRPPYCFWYVRIRSALCLSLCLCRPSFHWSQLRHKHKHKNKKNELVRFSCAFNMLMLVSTQFSLAYTCACAYAYAYAPVKLYMCSVFFLQL